jgi:hypothetical protein
MPPNTPVAVRQQVPKVTPEAIEAWRAGDYWALHAALGLKLWEIPDWNHEPPVAPPPDWPAALAAYEHTCAMQKQMIADGEITITPPAS